MGVSPYQQSHPYTDVSQVKQKGDFSCINLSCGYYNMHTPNEFVVVDDVENSFNLALNIVKEFGYNKFEYVYEKPSYDYDISDLFSRDSDDKDNKYDVLEWDESKNNFYYFDEKSIEIESKKTGDMVKLDLYDMYFLYQIIHEQLVSNNKI
jgi:hypothetical protein